MEKKKEYKHILDSVHGNIYIDKELVRNIVDTPAFQRLRRIEQTSTRAIFPSARHDRFIHSLGVYHIGSLMTKQLKKVVLESNDLKAYAKLIDNLSDCFEVACLLHDIGHSPFSHTFEKYFGEEVNDTEDGKQLLRDELLSELLKRRSPKSILINSTVMYSQRKKANFHELVSAIIAIKYFGKHIRQCRHSKYDNHEFVARMIIGCKYDYKKDDTDRQLRNCFIDLLHGGIIDADRLDYVLRDVWASGYRTSSVDIQRLIAGLFVDKNTENKGEYVVCFKSNVLNEIQSVLDVKDFQVQYVLNHHTVVLEQYFLEQAALEAAKALVAKSSNGPTPLREILRWNALTSKGIKLPTINICGQPLTIRYMCDDDLIFLMKLTNNDNAFYQKWANRKFGYTALWKTRDDFFYLFNVPRTSLGEKVINIVKDTLCAKFPVIHDEDILIKKITYKSRVELDDLHIYMSPGHVTDYKNLYREAGFLPRDTKREKGNKEKEENENTIFYYVYVKDKALRNLSVSELTEVLKEPITNEYRQEVDRLQKRDKLEKEIIEEIKKYLH